MIAALESLFPTGHSLRTGRVSARPLETQRTCTGPVPVAELAKNQLVALRAQRGQMVECLEGALWITFAYDQRDIVIEAGQTFVVDGDAAGWIQALTASRIRVTAAAGAATKDR